MWLIAVTVCLLAAPRVQLSVTTGPELKTHLAILSVSLLKYNFTSAYTLHLVRCLSLRSINIFGLSAPCLCRLLNVPTYHCADVSFDWRFVY